MESIPNEILARTPTLRDRFAAAALTGLLAAESHPDTECATFDVSAKMAYKQADAMIQAREAKNGRE